MPLIRIVLLLIVAGGLALVAFSNLSPVISLVFLGLPTPALPLATWMGIAIASGICTSFVLQFLQFLLVGSSTPPLQEPLEVPRQSRSFTRDYQEPISSRPYTAPPETPKTSAASASDWEEANDRNWDFESTGENSESQTNPRPDATVQSKSTERTNETTQQSKTDTPSGVYSYSYREQEKKQDGVGKADAVYDANYRVIRPPNPPVKSDDDDDDWGFEDDDDFNEQTNNPKGRR